MIRAIIFDCFGVLYHGSVTHLYQLIPEENHQQFSDLRKQADYGYITKQEYLFETSKLTGIDIIELELLIQSDHVRNNAMIDFVAEQKNQHKTALLSNVGSSVMNDLISEAEQANLFDVVVLSSDVGMTKPSREIFSLTAQKLGLAPEECLMIDDLASNIAGAQDAGMHGVVYENVAQVRLAINEIIETSN